MAVEKNNENSTVEDQIEETVEEQPEGLPVDVYDMVRKCLNLEPLRSAAAKGKQISNNIRKNIEERTNLTT